MQLKLVLVTSTSFGIAVPGSEMIGHVSRSKRAKIINREMHRAQSFTFVAIFFYVFVVTFHINSPVTRKFEMH